MSELPRISLFKTAGAIAAPVPVRVVPETALSSALRTAFRFLYAVVAVLAVVWLASGVRSVEPGAQAVIFRNGAIERTVGSGLVVAWPRPFEEVVLVPASERQLSMAVDRLDLLNREQGAIALGSGLDPRKDGGFALTGDAGVVHLRGSVTYAVNAPREYVLARERVETALTRVVLAATITACSQRSLDGVMVASPDGQDLARSESLAQSRERLRGDIVTNANQRLTTLKLGISIQRIDLTAFLPDKARPSFDAVIAAESSAAREIAEARTFAAKTKQDSESQRAQIIAEASSRARETISAANVATDTVRAVLAEDSPERRQVLLARLYRERIGVIIQHAGSTVTVPAGEPARIVVPGR